MKRTIVGAGLAIGMAVALLASNSLQLGWAADPPAPAAVARARKQVEVLDDVYKTAVVLITDKYVNKPEDFSAGSAAKALFDAMKKKGHHEVRLLDATGQPYSDENLPRDAFEKEAVQQLKAGKATFEKVESRADGNYLRVATSVPVVMKKCTMCHDNYAQVKAGVPIGALSYTLKIE